MLNLIGQHAGIPGEQIYAAGPVSANQPRVVQEPTALRRNVEITGESTPYRLNFESQLDVPTITINAQAPTMVQAVALANGAAVGLQEYVAGVERTQKIPAGARVAIRQLGHAHGAVVNGGIKKAVAALVFLAVLLAWCVLVLAASRFRLNWRASAALQAAGEDERSADPAVADELHGVGGPPGPGLHADYQAAGMSPVDVPTMHHEPVTVPTRGLR